MPDWDNTSSSERDEDATWRDLIARFDAPAAAEGPVPWPEREDVPAAPGALGSEGTGEAPGDGAPSDERAPAGTAAAETASAETPSAETPPAGTPSAETPSAETGRAAGDGDGSENTGPQRSGSGWGVRGADDADRIWRALEAEGLLGETEPDVIQATRRMSRSPVGWVPVRGAPANDEDEHFVPPVPPPLPKLDPVTKGAWAALFGGPGYLMLATALHWSVPGFAAFCAVAAFVTGFALLVLRMNEPGPGGPDDGDDGAVV